MSKGGRHRHQKDQGSKHENSLASRPVVDIGGYFVRTGTSPQVLSAPNASLISALPDQKPMKPEWMPAGPTVPAHGSALQVRVPGELTDSPSWARAERSKMRKTHKGKSGAEDGPHHGLPDLDEVFRAISASHNQRQDKVKYESSDDSGLSYNHEYQKAEDNESPAADADLLDGICEAGKEKQEGADLETHATTGLKRDTSGSTRSFSSDYGDDADGSAEDDASSTSSSSSSSSDSSSSAEEDQSDDENDTEPGGMSAPRANSHSDTEPDSFESPVNRLKRKFPDVFGELSTTSTPTSVATRNPPPPELEGEFKHFNSIVGKNLYRYPKVVLDAITRLESMIPKITQDYVKNNLSKKSKNFFARASGEDRPGMEETRRVVEVLEGATWLVGYLGRARLQTTGTGAEGMEQEIMRIARDRTREVEVLRTQVRALRGEVILLRRGQRRKI